MRPIFCFRRNSGAPLLNERWVRTSLERSVSLEDTAQVRLAEHDKVVERFATNRSDEPFDVAVLPRRARCRKVISDSHGTNAAGICWTERAIAVAN